MGSILMLCDKILPLENCLQLTISSDVETLFVISEMLSLSHSNKSRDKEH